MCKMIDTIVRCIHINHMNHNYSEVIEGDDRSIIRNFPMFVSSISQKLGNNFELYKEDVDFVVYRINNIYIVIDYDCVFFSSIDFNINMFDSMTEVDRYFSY